MSEDPGWKPVVRMLPFALMPQLARARSRRGGAPLIVLLRLVFVSLLFPLLVIPIILLFLDATGSFEAGEIAILAIVGSVGFVSSRWFHGRPVEAEDAASAVSEFQLRTMMGIALTEVVVLLGFVLFFWGDSSIVTYMVGAIVALPAFHLIAPTRASVDRFVSLTESGIDIRPALFEAQPTAE